jgi:hypothetical protein
MGEMKKKMYGGYRAVSVEREKSERERLNSKKDAAIKNADGRPTFAFFAAHDEAFIEACRKAGIPATARQASKWFRKRGLAYANKS